MRPYDEGISDRILQYINEYQLEKGESPGNLKIMEHLRLSSTSLVRRYVARLVSKGLVSKDNDGKIAVPSQLEKSKITMAAEVGDIACGTPFDAVENITASHALPQSLFGRGELFILTACGDSMDLCGIDDGDLVVLRKTTEAYNGDIVAVMNEEYEATLKELQLKNGYAEFIPHSSNEKHEPLKMKNYEILGVAVKIIKDVKIN